jgi:DNA processing protein
MERLFMLALSMVPGIGNIGAKRILSHTGSAEAVFNLDRRSLLKLPGVGELLADRMLDSSVIDRARGELEFTKKNGIECFIYGEENYPGRLGYCEDAPIVLFARGHLDLGQRKTISVVGTRRPTSYGLDLCRKLVKDLAERYPDLVVVSGLAYGIDRCAHETALDCGLRTVAVLGHGLKFLYPAVHRRIAKEIVTSGALITDFPAGEKPEPNNFVKRNRIIAGISEATVVIESGKKGGALITADLANSYNRDVFAFPGRSCDPSSAGCNHLIKSHRASLAESHKDVEYVLGWESIPVKQENRQKTIFRELEAEEGEVLQVLVSEGDSSVDLLSFRTGLPVSRLSAVLLNLELSGLITAIPGNCYRIIR